VWNKPQSSRLDMIGKKVTVFAKHSDNALFQNDMTIGSLAMGGSKVTLKP
jgi:hypothetical protein